MTFGYNTNITQGYKAANQGNIFSHARDLLYGLEVKRRQTPTRDLVFIAHSLGGILVKEVLRRSEVDPDQKIAKIFGSTTGVFFFGTPHRGSRDWASFGEGVAAVASRILGVDVNTQVIHALLPSGPELEICRESFTAQWVKRGDDLTVRTFQESKGVTGTQWGGFNQLIVPSDSSTLDHPGQRARTIEADHIGMVKFNGENDKAYEMVKEDIKELVTRADKAVHNLISDQPKEQEVEWSEEDCKCQQLLRTSDYESYKDRNPDRVKGTCQWFLKHPNFQTWHQSNTSSLLWVSADPGCGKSVLSKSLVEKELKSTESRATCYFFFKDDDVKQKSVTHALSALLHQLFSQRRFLIQYAIPDYESEGNLLPTLFHKLWTILTKAATNPKAGEVVCILDALDECEESGRYDIIKALSAFYKKANNTEGNPSKFKFLATSRPYLDIERRFTELTHDMPSVHLQGEKESRAISEEINLVIHFEAHKKIGLELKLNDSERSFLERKLSSMPHRTYLWLKLILEVIRSRTSVTQKGIQQIVSNLPTTVETAYEAILEKSSDKMLARKLLCIVVAAVRPLTLNEMNIALAIEDHHRSSKDLDLEDEIRFEGTVRHLCGLFISVIDQKVYLIHQTAKEFLLAKTEAYSGVWKYSIEPAVSELIVAKTCITYLLFAEFSSSLDIGGKSQAEKESKVKNHTDKHHYLGYAASQWAIHYQKAQARAEHGMQQSILDICDTQSQRFRNWFYVYWTLVHRYESTPGFMSSIIVVSYFGHEAVAKLLLETGKVNVESKDTKYGQTPLSWAARGGHEAVVKLLLETGKVDVESKDKYGRTPLSWAAEGGREAVVKLLLETGK
ncbi:ankyrin, partial [Cenococcum geophilum 1.58]|uniref:ankyrin n=1 Tax=Cenococcum geophilum 1.58 TaxID=794803 RepID=UPI00358F6F4F